MTLTAAVRKRRVRQTKPKREQRLYPGRVKPAIACIDTVLVTVPRQVPVQIPKILRAGVVIAIASGPGTGQFPAGCHVPGEYIRHGVSALLSRLRDEQRRTDVSALQYVCQFYRPAGIDNQNHGYSRTVQKAQVPLLRIGEIVIPLFQAAVPALARNSAYHIDGSFRSRKVPRCESPALRQPERIGRVGVKGIRDVLFLFQNLLFPAVSPLLIPNVIVPDPVRACNGESRLFQSLINRDRVPGVDAAGTGTSPDSLRRAAAQEGNWASFFQRKKAVVFQKNNSFRSRFSGQRLIAQFSCRDVWVFRPTVFYRVHMFPPVGCGGPGKSRRVNRIVFSWLKDRAGCHSLTPPSVTPAMMNLDRNRYTRIIGTMAIVIIMYILPMSKFM